MGLSVRITLPVDRSQSFTLEYPNILSQQPRAPMESSGERSSASPPPLLSTMFLNIQPVPTPHTSRWPVVVPITGPAIAHLARSLCMYSIATSHIDALLNV